jgi:hypothetical protein
MASVTYKNLALNDQITGTAAASVDDVYTQSSGVSQINSASVYNSSASSVTIFVYILASGVAATSVDPVCRKTIAAGASEPLDVLIGHIVPNAGTVKAYAGTTNVLRLTISGVEVVL